MLWIKNPLKNLEPKKVVNIICTFFYCQKWPAVQITQRWCTIAAAQFFQTLKNETLTRGASLTTLTTILFTSNNYSSQQFFFQGKEKFSGYLFKTYAIINEAWFTVGGICLASYYPVFPMHIRVFLYIVGKCRFRFSNWVKIHIQGRRKHDVRF